LPAEASVPGALGTPSSGGSGSARSGRCHFRLPSTNFCSPGLCGAPGRRGCGWGFGSGIARPGKPDEIPTLRLNRWSRATRTSSLLAHATTLAAFFFALQRFFFGVLHANEEALF